MRGGSRPNAGRKAGSTAAKTVERLKNVAKVMQVVNDTIPEAFKGDAHSFLIAVYKDPSIALKDRLAAAQAAVGYEKPKLAAVEHSGDMTLTHETALAALESKANGVELHQ